MAIAWPSGADKCSKNQRGSGPSVEAGQRSAAKPRSRERVQPTAQAVGGKGMDQKALKGRKKPMGDFM